jgi:dipeptide/tripeptide permease
MSTNKEIELDKLASALSDELPGDVSTHEQLSQVPEECLSSNPNRPLLHTDANGNSYTYSLNPLYYSVFLILVLELLERFSFYGLYMSQTNYLTGSYDENWNADMSSMEAASLVSLSTAVAYTVPFLGGILADGYLGDYKTILLGTVAFYLPGLFLISSSTAPNWWLGKDEFNVKAYKMALLFFWPIGTGIVKSVVNVFGARQYHPVLQRSMIESFYVRFYMVINVGAVAGCIVIPVVARSSITVAYTIPFLLLLVAVTFFMMGSSRYVIVAPGESNPELHVNAGSAEDLNAKASFVDVAKICMLIVPFNIAYSQCPTTFMVQGSVMKPFLGFIEAPNLDILDSVSVLVCGYFVSTYIYPYLASKNIKIPTGIKFALGSGFGVLAILWSLLVEQMIHSEYARSGQMINVLWQSPSYILIGAGEIFSISTAYEVAFTASPPNKKAFACAFNLFCIGGIPNMLSLCLYRLCEQWFQNSSGVGNIRLIKDYAEAHVANYFLVLLGIVLFGVAVNLIPSVSTWIASVERRAAEASMANTPKPTPKSTPKTRQGAASKESEPLLAARKHKKYLEQAKGPDLYRANTMKAEFAKKSQKK